MNQVVVALGGNMGDVPQTFGTAIRTLVDHPQIRKLQSARLFSSAPMGEHSGDQLGTEADAEQRSAAPKCVIF